MARPWWVTAEQPTSYQCLACGNWGLCAGDCSLAPWNQERPATTPFIYLLRQRRWAGMPVVRPIGDRRLLSSRI
jgi:hypothetical protein